MSDTQEKQPTESQSRIEQLTEANKELEQFAYVASHDLREPLRVIACFTELLAKEYSTKFDETARQYMEISRDAAKKLEATVADLLEYGRIGHNEAPMSPTDCTRIVTEAQEVLAGTIEAAKASMTFGRLPTINANPLRLERLFRNLIGNALTYHAPGKRPVISICAEERGNDWLFSIKDNGMGIEPEYLEAIFAPFKRLHTDEYYKGTGLGLAICKRIVAKMGGNIWAESTPGIGSTFFFTLPKLA